MIDLGRIVQMRERKLADHRQAEKMAMQQLVGAVAAVERSRAEMAAYAEEVKSIESDMINDLIGKEIKIDDIRKIEEKLREVKERAEALADAHTKAKNARDEKERQHQKVQAGRAAAESKFNKISEIDKILVEERRVEARAAEDAEMDGFVDMIAGKGRL